MRPMQRVLVIEDDSAVADVCRVHLAEAGFEVDVVRTGEEALAAVREGDGFDAIVLDMRLPDANGIRLFDSMTEIDDRLRERTVAISSDGWFESRLPCPFLKKPFGLDDLETLVRAACSGRSKP